MSEDWSWDLPDEGRWALTRLELGAVAVDGERVLVGSSRKPGLWELDRASGLPRRRIATEGPVQAAPVHIEGGWLVVDAFGVVYRLDESLAPAVWKEPYRSGAAVFRPPAVAGDFVLLGTASDSVIAVGLADGAWKWSYEHEVSRGSQELAILGAPTPQLRGEEVLAGFSDGALVGIDLETGVERWVAAVGSGKFPDLQAEPAIAGDTIFAAAFGGPVVALDASTRSERWRNEEAGASSTLIHDGDFLYMTDARGRLLSLDAATGAQAWVWELPDTQLGSPALAASSILVGDASGTLFAVDRWSGKEQWRFRPSDGTRPGGVAAAPLLDGRQLLFPTAGGTLHSLIAERDAGGDRSEEPSKRADRPLGW